MITKYPALTCNKESHKGKAITFLCTLKECDDRYLCEMCLIKCHKQHIKHVELIEEFNESLKAESLLEGERRRKSDILKKILSEKEKNIELFTAKQEENRKELAYSIDLIKQILKEKQGTILDLATEQQRHQSKLIDECLVSLKNFISKPKHSSEVKAPPLSENSVDKESLLKLLREQQQKSERRSLPDCFFSAMILSKARSHFLNERKVDELKSLQISLRCPFPKSADDPFYFVQSKEIGFERDDILELKALKNLNLKKQIRIIEYLGGRNFLLVSDENTISIVNADTLMILKSFSAVNKGKINVVIRFADNKIAVGYNNNLIKIWDYINGACVETIDVHTNEIKSLIELPENCLISASLDKNIVIYSVNDKSIKKKLSSPKQEEISKIILLPNSKLTAQGRKNIFIYDLASGNLLRCIEQPIKQVLDMALSSDLANLITISEDHTVYVWNIFTGNCVHKSIDPGVLARKIKRISLNCYIVLGDNHCSMLKLCCRKNEILVTIEKAGLADCALDAARVQELLVFLEEKNLSFFRFHQVNARAF